MKLLHSNLIVSVICAFKGPLTSTWQLHLKNYEYILQSSCFPVGWEYEKHKRYFLKGSLIAFTNQKLSCSSFIFLTTLKNPKIFTIKSLYTGNPQSLCRCLCVQSPPQRGLHSRQQQQAHNSRGKNRPAVLRIMLYCSLIIFYMIDICHN